MQVAGRRSLLIRVEGFDNVNAASRHKAEDNLGRVRRENAWTFWQRIMILVSAANIVGDESDEQKRFDKIRRDL